MHEVHFYKDPKGNEPVLDYMKGLASKTDKNSRVKLKKVQEYIQVLREHGTWVGMPYLKHLGGDLWELRPMRDRIFFVAWVNGSYVLLHHFVKKTQKTPQKEIEQAKRELADLKNRGM